MCDVSQDSPNIFLLSKFLTDIPGYNVDANWHESVVLGLDNYLKSMVSIYSEMGVLKVAKQNQQKLSSFDQVSLKFIYETS